MLEELGAFDATDIAEYTPNVSIVPTLGSGANIRMENGCQLQGLH